ncbi:response regulator transcription factor [Mycolicibacterium sp. Dal123E01]|uniref:response regulator transcription factor n=1 Tax=Mycolicibacterium sp. Dal123E01 TaxID=3457578 RepID=UPI00403E53FA
MTRPSELIRVIVGDDHPMYRAGVVRALKDSGVITVLAEVTDGRAALAAIREHEPAVAVIDYRMPDLDGLEVVHAVIRDELPTSVVILSAFDDDAVVYKALAAGAAGYLTKEADVDEIVAAVVRWAKGQRYISPQLAAGLANEVHQRSRGDTPLLTPRERETVQMIAEGLSVPQMAKRLHLSPTTVRTHVQNLYEKLGVSDRGAAVAEAMRRRLVD